MHAHLRRLTVLPATLVVSILALGLTLSPSASARSSYAQVGYFGNASSDESPAQGEFRAPQRVAVASPGAPGAGDVYVADTGNHRTEVFTPAAPGPCGSACATFLTEFGAGELSEPVGVAVDPASGAVYVTDAGLSEVVKYDRTSASPPTFARDTGFTSPPAGSGAGQVGCFGTRPVGFGVRLGGIAVDPEVDPLTGTHDVLLADPCKSPGEIERFTSTGSFVEEWDGASSGEAFGKPADLAVSSGGDVIVADLNESAGSVRFLRFSGTGAYQGPTLEPVPNPYPLGLGAVVGADTATGEAFASSATGESPLGQVYRFDSANSPIGNFGAEGKAFDLTFDGIAASSTSPDRLYVPANGTVNGLNQVPRVQVFESSAFPEVTAEAVKSEDLTPVRAAGVVGATAYETTFHGTVNPSAGTLTACRFEYVTQAQFQADGYAEAEQASCEPSAATIGNRNEVVDVRAKAIDLQPHATYHLRLFASNSGLNGEAEASMFATPAPAPAVETQKAWSVTEDGATLTAAVDPNDSEVTECRFEYGETGAYGHTAPCSPARPGAGHAFVQVLANVEGLSPQTTYHFRLQATNACAQGCGAQQSQDVTFATRAPAAFPERHFELVSLLDNNGVWALPIEASPDGEHYAYASEILPFPGTDQGTFTPMRASRVVHPDGTVSWEQQYLGASHPVSGEPGGSEPGIFSADLSRVAWSTSQGIDPADGNHAEDTYLRNAEDGSLSWLSCTPVPPSTACPPPAGASPQTDHVPAGEPLYVSGDGSRVLFASERHLLPGDIQNVQQGESLYESHEGDLSLVGVRPGSSEGFAAGSTLGSNHSTGGEVQVYGNPVTRNAVSRDGRRVVFQSGSELETRRLYVRVDGEHTVEASAPVPGAPPLSGACSVGEGGSSLPVACNVNYWGADENDESVFFSSGSPLTADSNAPGTKIVPASAAGGSADLYRYLVPADGDPVHGHLVDLTAQSTHPAEAGAGVTQVLWVSNDGHRVYFLARAALTPDASPATHCDEGAAGLAGLSGGACNLYLAEVGAAGQPARLTLIASGEIRLGGNEEGAGDFHQKERQVSANPEGSVLAFRSADALVPGMQTGGMQQVYVYDAARNELDCASCTPDGSPPPAAWAGLTPAEPVESHGVPVGSVGGVNHRVPHVRNVAADGAVFFETASSLLAADANGKMNVYEWLGGRLHPISEAGPSASIYGDASTDGSSVFIASANQLVRGVEGGTVRIYAARVGPPPPETLPSPPCTGEDCKPVATPQPEALTPGSFSLFGPGNFTPAPAARPVKPKSEAQLRAERLAKALNACRAKRNKHKRRVCESQAKKRYSPTHRAKKSNRRRARRAAAGSARPER